MSELIAIAKSFAPWESVILAILLVSPMMAGLFMTAVFDKITKAFGMQLGALPYLFGLIITQIITILIGQINWAFSISFILGSIGYFINVYILNSKEI